MKIKEKFISLNEPGKRILFMSDLHYYHANVIRHNSRGFKDVQEMNNFILGELKSRISPGDILFDLGDLFWNITPNQMCEVLDQIPTNNIYKIVGNHDRYGVYYGSGGLEVRKRFKIVCDILDIQVESWKTGETYMVTMSHYPMISWNHKPHGSIHLHGHTHSNIDCLNDNSPDLRVDVGFDGHLAKDTGSFIIDFEDIIQFFDNKTGGISYKSWVIDKSYNL